MIITQLSFCLFHFLTLTQTVILDFHQTPFWLRCILGEPFLRTVLASWLSGQAPWLPLNCMLLRWDNQVGGTLKKRSEQSSGFNRERSFFPCDNTKVVCMHAESLKRSRPGYSEKHGRQDLQVCSTKQCQYWLLRIILLWSLNYKTKFKVIKEI